MSFDSFDLGLGVELKTGTYYDRHGTEHDCVIAIVGGERLVFDAVTKAEVKRYQRLIIDEDDEEEDAE